MLVHVMRITHQLADRQALFELLPFTNIQNRLALLGAQLQSKKQKRACT